MRIGRLILVFTLAAAIAGCNANSSGGSGGGVSLGSLIGGKAGQYTDAGLKAGSALTMTAEQEDEMGRTVAIAATNRWPLYEKPKLTNYVTLVGLTLASASSRPDGNWVFGVLDTPEIGAYSGPNGYIMVTRGAIAAMEDESELAAVLAHEMAHVLNQDGVNAVKNARLTEAGMQAVNASDRRIAEFNQRSNQLVQTVLTSGWSQPQETKADSDAVRLLRDAGYDPSGLPRFLSRMQQRRGTGGSAKPFGTHPGTADRIMRTTSQSSGDRGGATHRERFAAMAADAKL
jgi:predicted Zn-dependent protease